MLPGMNKEQTRERLQQILNELVNNDITFVETKYPDGTGMVESHIGWIERHSIDGWDEQVAQDRITTLEIGVAEQEL
jgi:hypothetical protein